ncbi:MAG: DUF1905 domain-containing protein [Bacteroidetes bacterium]|nr:DUF1905 domain-containing protein [Bacteroidota bacterium]MBS1648771.1 DUF1905 domain-containing protein [Bacteroidota bacterium]
MIQFSTILKKFDKQGEKTGWTYIEISETIAQQLKPNNKKSFRVKGKLDEFEFQGVALLPMGDGTFIMAINASMRKGIKKIKGDKIKVQLKEDKKGYELNKEFIECLNDEPKAYSFFKKLPQGHQNYFSKWIESAKTIETKSKRIAMAINALAKQWDYGTMIRTHTAENKKLKNW